MVMGLSPGDAMKILSSGEGKRLVDTLKRIVQSEGIPIDELMRQAREHMEQMEGLARRSNTTVKQVADASLKMYEAHLAVDGR